MLSKLTILLTFGHVGLLLALMLLIDAVVQGRG